MRVLLLIVFSSPLALAQAGNYEAILDEAVRLQREVRSGEHPDQPYVRAYEKLAEACLLNPRRYEAFLQRGINRCDLAGIVRGMLVRRLNALKVSGGTAEALATKERRGQDYIGALMQHARQNFRSMTPRLRASRREDVNELIRFTEASMKYAQQIYLGADGRAGAIEDLEALVKRGWQPKRCSEYIARCYLQLGAVALVTHQAYEKAQELWDEALKWAQSERTKRDILTNKAGAYESSGAHGQAKKVLRKQIDREPLRPGHRKNLGLLLGYEGKLKEALHAYGEARELCKHPKFFLGFLHGSAWLKAANIHGKLLQDDGDMLVAWRLFMEYRAMFGDDYNFSVDFGRFALEMEQYELAHGFLTRARGLQPFCQMPYMVLIEVVKKMEGTSEEVRQRIVAATESAKNARVKYDFHEEKSPSVQRMCAGNVDRSDGSTDPAKKSRIEPDPLAGFAIERPPDWIVRAASERLPFEPWEPSSDGDDGGLNPVNPANSAPSGWIPWALAGAILIGAAGVAGRLRARA